MSRTSDRVDLNDVQADVGHLFHLLETIVDILHDMPYERDGERDDQLDRVNSLTQIACDRGRDLGLAIDNNFRAILSAGALAAVET